VDLISRSIGLGLEENEMRALKLFVLSIVVLGALSVGTAFAQSGGGVPNPSGAEVKGTGQVSNPAVESEGQVEGQGSSSSSLPFTGADITLFLAIGVGAIGTGLYFVRTSRSNRQEA
jgi:hypothetical protein